MDLIQEAKEHLSALADAGAMDTGDTGDTGDPVVEKNVKAAMAKLGETGAILQPLVGSPRVAEVIGRLSRQAGERLTAEHIAEVAAHLAGLERRRAHQHGRREGLRLASRRGGVMGMPGTLALPDGAVDHNADAPWRRGDSMKGYRYDVMRRYLQMHGGRCVTQRGKYWSTFQVPFQVATNTGSSSATTGNFYITVPPQAQATLQNPGYPNPPVDLCFNFALGQSDPFWFGSTAANPHITNLGDTNLQYPGENLYPDEVFVIEAVSTALKGLRIQYNPALIPNFANLDASIQAQLTGQSLVWDRQGIILPAGLFNELDDTCELAQALSQMAVVQLAWFNLGLGANNVLVTKPIERMVAVPGMNRREIAETSGGALSLELLHGMLWCLDSTFQANTDEGGNGLMNGEMLLNDNVSFPFTPIQVYGSAGAIAPMGIALEWQLILHGTSIVPAKENFSKVAQRRK